jgi:hypothetical protein
MVGDPYNPDYDYVAYIDESGDQGLQKVKPLDPDGSSEWLIVSGVVIRKENEAIASQWVRHIIEKLDSPQLRSLHFRKLDPPWRKETICREIAALPLRSFVVCSNKKNMRGYENPFAAQVPSQNWFYCWLTRVLLEKITHFVAADSRQRFGAVRRVKLVYSRAGGLRYGQMAAYYEWIREKRRNDNQVLFWGDLEYETVHSLLLEVRHHRDEPRLALADAVASAFFRACDKRDTGACNTAFATLLAPRMAATPDRKGGTVAGYGVKLLPGWKKAAHDRDQQEIFRHFGYPKQWWDNRWAPDPFVP